ncbi:MAG TPA: hypothetical protein VM925_33385, partial [Labilithrix sp.]|nr:hypothetical protein [Labilithrix sp.]
AATATATAAGIAATPAKPSALPTAPFAHPGLQPKLTAKPVVTSTTPKPKATGKPGDEPDLGY